MRYSFLSIVLFAQISFAQTFNGSVVDGETGEPIEFVNIGIMGESLGTVSSEAGKYELTIGTEFDQGTIKFSCIGYDPFVLKVVDFKKLNSHTISLQRGVYNLNEIVVIPKDYVRKTLGVKTTSQFMQAGYKDNILGYEYGLLMKARKTSFIQKININFGQCSYDTIFYRLNIYHRNRDNQFENILQKPIYIKFTKADLEETLIIDLTEKYVQVKGEFLVSLEHVRNMGEGTLYFCSGFKGKTFYRKTSQASWGKIPIGISISADVLMER